MAKQAQDTFVAEINGSPLLVQKGSVWSPSHPVVKLDAGRGILFRDLDLGDEEEPAKPKSPRVPKSAGFVKGQVS